MAQITYTNKVALNENPEIADINKVTDDDMNEIKSVVNTNDGLRGDLSTLTTTTKTSTVAAINELNSDKASTNEVIISNIQPTANDNKLWIDTGEVGNQVSEITNTYSTSTGLGYSANYVNNITKKNIITCKLATETTYSTSINYRIRLVPMDTIVSQVGSDLELTSDGGIKIKGNFKYVKVSLSVGLGSSNAANSYGLGLGKSTYDNIYVGNSFFSIVDQYNHANTFKLMSSNELLISVNQNDVIYGGVYVFTAGNVQVRSAYLTIEVVE